MADWTNAGQSGHPWRVATTSRSARHRRPAGVNAAVRTLPAHEPAIVHATDLGGVQVLKHGELYLLTDGFGDIHPDSRGLGLYLGDTRIVSCLALRINGARPVLLRADTGANYRGTIQLTNSDYSPDQSRKVDPTLALARQSLGITRDRVLATGLDERIRIANFSPHPEDLTIELLVDVDAADIFEVRGRQRPERGTMLPITVRGDGRVTFAYAGLDGSTRRTYVDAAAPDTIAASGEREGAVVLRWRRRLPRAATRPSAGRSGRASARRSRPLMEALPLMATAAGPATPSCSLLRPRSIRSSAPRPTGPGPSTRRSSTRTTSCSTSPSGGACRTCAS